MAPVSFAISGVHSLPCQSIACVGASPIPSHHTSPSSVSATLVKNGITLQAAHAVGVGHHVGAGCHAKVARFWVDWRANAPLHRALIQAMSFTNRRDLPTLEAFLVESAWRNLSLPQALGKAAATWYFLPSGFGDAQNQTCASANQPCVWPMVEAMRKAKHFLPNNALPP